MKISKMISYRSVWMGFAMIWVVLYHCGLVLPGGLDHLKGVGYGGVDIFLFASGIGNYYSYNKDEDPLKFMRRRIKRLAPAYVPIVLLWCMWVVVTEGLYPWYITGNLLGVQGISAGGRSFNWYIICILICYLLTPYLASYIKKHNDVKSLILILLLIVMSAAFFKDSKRIIIMARIPVYALGMLFAKHDNVDVKRVRMPLFALFAFGVVVLEVACRYVGDYMWNYGLYWYPFIMIAPFMCLMISELSALLEKRGTSKVVGFFSFIGGISFEIYLVHVLTFDIFKTLATDGPYDNNWTWSACLLVTFFLAWLYSLLLKKVGQRGRFSSSQQPVGHWGHFSLSRKSS